VVCVYHSTPGMCWIEKTLRHSPNSPLLRTGSSGSQALEQRQPWRSEVELGRIALL